MSMGKRERKRCLRIEIGECLWREDLKFVIRTGDINGSTTCSNFSFKDVLKQVKSEMELNWPELDKKAPKTVKKPKKRAGDKMPGSNYASLKANK